MKDDWIIPSIIDCLIVGQPVIALALVAFVQWRKHKAV